MRTILLQHHCLFSSINSDLRALFRQTGAPDTDTSRRARLVAAGMDGVIKVLCPITGTMITSVPPLPPNISNVSMNIHGTLSNEQQRQTALVMLSVP